MSILANDKWSKLESALIVNKTYTADRFRDGRCSLVSARQHHLVDDYLFSSHDNAILADDSANSAAKRLRSQNIDLVSRANHLISD